MAKKASYTVFTDTMLELLGELDWRLLGTMTKKYKQKFIVKCAKQVPEYILRQGPRQKTSYLNAICRNTAIDSDIIRKGKKVVTPDMSEQFSISKQNRRNQQHD